MMSASFTPARPALTCSNSERRAMACGCSAFQRSCSLRATAMACPLRLRASLDCAGWLSEHAGQRTCLDLARGPPQSTQVASATAARSGSRAAALRTGLPAIAPACARSALSAASLALLLAYLVLAGHRLGRCEWCRERELALDLAGESVVNYGCRTSPLRAHQELPVTWPLTGSTTRAFATCTAPPATRHPPPATRHPPPATRHPPPEGSATMSRRSSVSCMRKNRTYG